MNSNSVVVCHGQWPSTHECNKDINVQPCLFLLSRIIHQGHLVKSKKELLNDMGSNLLLYEISGVE